jgi:transposase
MCRNHICPRKIFTERFCSELGTYSRRLQRSQDLLTKIGLELGGVKTAMISRWVGSSVSAATVIRMIRSLPGVNGIICSGVIGVDDWALKKGRTYGTILVDLHQNRVIDLWEGALRKRSNLGLNNTRRYILWPGTGLRPMHWVSARVPRKPGR